MRPYGNLDAAVVVALALSARAKKGRRSAPPVETPQARELREWNEAVAARKAAKKARKEASGVKS